VLRPIQRPIRTPISSVPTSPGTHFANTPQDSLFGPAYDPYVSQKHTYTFPTNTHPYVIEIMVRFAYWKDYDLRDPVQFEQANDAELVTEELRDEMGEKG
jgi:hypothetical protein